MKKKVIQIFEIAVLLLVAMGLLACGANVVGSTESLFGGGESDFSENEQPLEIKVWTYFSGIQQEAFQEALDRFNEGRGKDICVEVKSYNPGSTLDLQMNLYSLNEKNLATGDYPDIISLHTDTAMILEEEGLLTDLDPYFTKEEWSKFVPSFIEEGRLGRKYGGVKDSTCCKIYRITLSQ